MTRTLDMALIEILARTLVEGGRRSQTPHLVIDVPSFEQAKRYAWESKQVFPVEPEVMDLLMNKTGYEASLGWTDMREHMAGRELRGRSYTLHFRRDPSCFDRVFDHVDRILASHPEAREVSEDIASDLYHCALARYLHGARYGFWERVLFVYRHGYWPCGWSGTFPDMQFIGYRFSSVK
jgi:hypothetical protein